VHILRTLVALILTLGLVSVPADAAKKREWQMGRLLDSNRVAAANVVFAHFQIEGLTLTYLASERLSWRWSKAANLTVNGPVKFAVEGRKLFVIDEDGKEHEMQIIAKTLRKPGEPPKQYENN
jgi:hypothetical protein